MLVNEKSRKKNAVSISFMGRKSVKTFISGGKLNFTCILIFYMARLFRKYVLHCNGIYPFVTLMNFKVGDPFHVTTPFLEVIQHHRPIRTPPFILVPIHVVKQHCKSSWKQ